ncbi:DinB family protein [Paenactinomyces guangxiensis]|uniref:DinB family protein n=1 Tax=Paenactinomyces guangxiensis TaxID=1490290 RepID=A0A7W1WSN8_9BACL|nr:DinB family protein [Paenactinomyces guangxiensis]MBA4495330.1 DinB family protein [Paenactinomyces guangxiensis]MBH8592549.1 DinB family protein [Paenactinomyces guangxiensis]
MNKFKQEILQHQLNSIEYVKSLNTLSEKEWRAQIHEGKWTVAEIIGHFIPWDEFVLHKRLPYLFSEHELPKCPDSEKTNEKSASISREQNKRVTIDNFVSTRKALYKAIDEIPNDRWEVKFSIGKTTLSLYEYFKGLAQHDLHHFEQIKNTIRLLM